MEMKLNSMARLLLCLLFLLLLLLLNQTAFAFSESEEKKHRESDMVKKMKEKLIDLKDFGEDGKSEPFTVYGPYGETLFVVKTVDGNFETTPSGYRVAPSSEDITRWMFVQEDGTLGRSPGVRSGSSNNRDEDGEEKKGGDVRVNGDGDEDVITIQYSRRNKRFNRKVNKKTNRNKRKAKVEV